MVRFYKIIGIQIKYLLKNLQIGGGLTKLGLQ